jgi:hypothetical protein
LHSGKNVYEVLGTGFTLLTLGQEPKEQQMWVDAAAAMNIPLTLVQEPAHSETKTETDRYEAKSILVRPDQFVAWASQEAPSDAAQAQQLLRSIVGGH